MTVKQLKDYLSRFEDELEINIINKFSSSDNIYIEFKTELKD